MMSNSNSPLFREVGRLICVAVISFLDYEPLLASPHGHHRFSAASDRGDRTLGNRSGHATRSTAESRVCELQLLSLCPIPSVTACADRSAATLGLGVQRAGRPRTRESAAAGCLVCSARRVAADRRWNIRSGSFPHNLPVLCCQRTAPDRPKTRRSPAP